VPRVVVIEQHAAKTAPFSGKFHCRVGGAPRRSRAEPALDLIGGRNPIGHVPHAIAFASTGRWIPVYTHASNALRQLHAWRLSEASSGRTHAAVGSLAGVIMKVQ